MATLKDLIVQGSARVVGDLFAGTITEGGTTLANKYLGKTAQAADSAKLGGLAAASFATKVKIGSATTEYSASNNIVTLPAYPTKSSWNYDDTYLKLSGGTITSTSWNNQLHIYRKEDTQNVGIGYYYGASTKTLLGVIGFLSGIDSKHPDWWDGTSYYRLVYTSAGNTAAVGGSSQPVYVNANGQITACDSYPTTLPASDVSAWAKAATKPSYGFSEITGTVTNAQLAGSIANGKLANSSMTIAGTSVSLGGSITAATIGAALTSSSPAAYATNAGTATKLGTATVGGTSTPIYLNAGTPTSCGGTFVKQGSFIDTHSEGNVTGWIDGTNELYAYYDRGGDSVGYEYNLAYNADALPANTLFKPWDLSASKTATTVAKINANVFNSLTGYNQGTVYSGNNFAVYDLTLPTTYSWGTHFYWSFGNDNWKPKFMQILVSYTGWADKTYISKYYSGNAAAYGRVSVNQEGKNAEGAATYSINRIRIVVSKYSRLAAFGLVNYGTTGLHINYMSRVVDDSLYRNISVAKNNTYNLGSSTNKWANVYATTFNGALSGNASTASNCNYSGAASTSTFVVKRTDTNGGAFVRYYSNNQETNYWLVGSIQDSSQFIFHRNGTTLSYIDSNGVYNGAATNVNVGEASTTSDIERKIVGHNESSSLYGIDGVTINWKYKRITATTFKGALEGNASTATALKNYYSSRQASMNVQFGDGAVRHFVASSATTTGKPTIGDAHILHLAWDNNNGYDAQLAVATGGNALQVRTQNGGTWRDWTTIYTNANVNSTSVDWTAKNLTLAGSITGATSGAFSGNVTIGGTLATTGATTFSSTLSVAGNVTLSSEATITSLIAGSLLVNGDARFVNTINGTIDKANTLATSRTIWGQSFNGSANVSGAMIGVTSITMNGALSGATTGAFSNNVTVGGNLTVNGGVSALGVANTSSSTDLPTTLAQLTDTTISSPANGQFLGYGNGKWSNMTLPMAGTSTLGCIKTGLSNSGRNFALKVDGSGNGYVNVPSDIPTDNARFKCFEYAANAISSGTVTVNHGLNNSTPMVYAMYSGTATANYYYMCSGTSASAMYNVEVVDANNVKVELGTNYVSKKVRIFVIG